MEFRQIPRRFQKFRRFSDVTFSSLEPSLQQVFASVFQNGQALSFFIKDDLIDIMISLLP